jgi:hypothetical protein
MSLQLTACVSRLGWDATTPLCRNQLQAKKKLKKRGAYPKSAARRVGCGFDHFALYGNNLGLISARNTSSKKMIPWVITAGSDHHKNWISFFRWNVSKTVRNATGPPHRAELITASYVQETIKSIAPAPDPIRNRGHRTNPCNTKLRINP